MEDKMYGYKVGIKHTLNYSSQHSDETYGDCDESYENTFDFIEFEDEYPDVVSVENLKPGDAVYVVWCEWSVGDSSGNYANGDAEAIAVFSNYDDAVGLQKSIKYDKHSYSFTASTGQKFERDNLPWIGRFENLEMVNIASTSIRDTEE